MESTVVMRKDGLPHPRAPPSSPLCEGEGGVRGVAAKRSSTIKKLCIEDGVV